jgi:hypothetical protein
MAASAALTIPMKLPTPLSAALALDVLARSAGASDVAVDATASTATFKYQVPGSLDKIVAKLAAKGIHIGGWVKVGIPVRPSTPATVIDGPTLVAHLNASPAVKDATFDGHMVGADVFPATNAMRFVFEELIVAGLLPIDEPTPAHPQDFVL